MAEKLKLEEETKARIDQESKIAKLALDLAEKNIRKIGKLTEDEITTKVDSWANKLDTSIKVASDVLTSVDKKITQNIEDYVNIQQKMAASLSGANSDYRSISDDLSRILSATGLIRQENVYKHLNEMISKGIINNVEQRAFLQTMSDDLNLMLNSTNGTLTRLIRLQGEDLSANRLAIQYNLREFLNSTYQNSEYVKQAMDNVSSALIDMQSLMTSESAMATEANIQQWLGSYFSAGTSESTVTSLARAINELGSGNISNIGQGISNLILMGVSRAGLDYGRILNEGLTSEMSDAIMQGVSNYLTEIGDINSNVVKSQLANIFGVGISDIAAIANLRTSESKTVTADPSRMFGQYESFIPETRQLKNLLDNFLYSSGMNIAQSPLLYGTYWTTGLLSELTEGQSILGVDVGKAMKAARLSAVALGAMTSVFDSFSSLKAQGDAIVSGGSKISGLYNALGDFSKVITATSDTVSSAIHVGSSKKMLEESATSLSETGIDIIEPDVVSDSEKLDHVDINVLNIYEYLSDTLEQHLATIENSVTSMQSIIEMGGIG